MSPQIYEFTLGNFRAWAIQDENGAPPVKDCFPHATSAELEAAAKRFGFAVDGNIELSFTTLLLDTGQEKILFDTGNGVDTGGEGRLFSHLASMDIARESINKVVLSHAHGDHYAGILSATGQLNFPNAQHFIWREEWAFYSSTERLAFEQNRSLERYEFIQKYFLPIAPHWHFLDENQPEIAAGIQAIPAKGHTMHHCAFRIESEGVILYFAGDAFLHPAYIENWHWGYNTDIEQETAKLSRKMLAARIAEEKALVLGYHFPFPSLGRVVAEGNKFIWQA